MGSFDELKKAAERWLGEHSSKFELLSADQNEYRLVFGVPDAQNSFNVICPTKEQSWGVCSEQESMLMQLQDVMEYIDSHSQDNLTIDMVLTRISKSITDLPSSSQCPSDQASKNLKKEEIEDDDNFEDAEDAEEEEDDDDDDDDDDDMNYYGDDDLDAQEEVPEEMKAAEPPMETFFKDQSMTASPATVQRLYSDLRSLNRTEGKYGFVAEPVQCNLFKWMVKLTDIPPDSKLGKDLTKYAEKTKHEAVISMEMQFPSDYPFSPPFLRVIRPRFQFLTGHVTIGGSICMQMLTKSGWMPTNDIEGILVQVRSEILSDPNAALDFSKVNSPYSESEARAAFDRMVHRYGWDK